MIIYEHFILFEGIGKNFHSILDFSILSDFKMSTVIFARGDFLVGFQPAKIWSSLALPPPSYTHIK